MSQSSNSVSPESLSSAKSNCKRSVFPGRITRVDRTGESSSSDMTSSQQNLVMSNPSSEIRSRKRLVPLQRGSSDSCVNDQLELAHLDSSPVSSHGHRFISANLNQPTWCDKCGDFIWGVYKQCLICTSTFVFSLSFACQLGCPCKKIKLTYKKTVGQPPMNDKLYHLKTKTKWN